MNIYVAHSKALDYKNELYIPLRRSKLNQKHTIILPHEASDKPYSSKEFFRDECQMLIVEVSLKGRGEYIEAGMAAAFGVPIIAMHRTGTDLSSSVKALDPQIVTYRSARDMIMQLEELLE